MFVRPNRPRAPGVVAVVAGWMVACAPRDPPTTTGPGAPDGGFEFPSLAVEWTPPMLAAGDVERLARTLGEHPQATLVLGPRLAGATWAARTTALVTGLGPTTVTQVRHAELATIVAPAAGLLELKREATAEGERPRYVAAMTVAPGEASAAVVAIDDVAVDPQRWQGLPSSSVGSCEPAMAALADGQEAALVRLAPFLDHADARLGEVYRAKLRAAPGLAAQCGEVASALTNCVADAKAGCPGAPRVVLVGGARVAAAEVRASEGCAAKLRGLADAAASEVSAGLDAGWTTLADRLGTLTEVHAALEDVCVPRRRRFAPADLDEARARLARIGTALASDQVRGEGGWTADAAKVAVPGLGTMRGVLRFDAGVGSVNTIIVAEARALREFVLGRALCKAGHAATPMAAVVGVPGQAAQFLGYFYEEELLCGELGPLR